MTDRKPDIMNATGAHRAWIGERVGDAQFRSLNGSRDAARQLGARSPSGAKVNPRHAAITKGLANFPNYKTWAEKAKSNWKNDKSE